MVALDVCSKEKYSNSISFWFLQNLATKILSVSVVYCYKLLAILVNLLSHCIHLNNSKLILSESGNKSKRYVTIKNVTSVAVLHDRRHTFKIW